MRVFAVPAKPPGDLSAAGPSRSRSNIERVASAREKRQLGNGYVLWVCAGYALLTITICVIEVKRTRSSGPDVLSLFMALFLVQCCLPAIVIFGCLRITGVDQPTGNAMFDGIFAVTDLSSSLLVLGLTAWFAILIYLFMGFGSIVIRRVLPDVAPNRWILFRASLARLLIVLLLGAALTVVAFWKMGDTLFERYARLIAFRAGSDEFDGKHTLNTVAFLLTQTWMWLSVVALFAIFERRGRNFAWYVCLLCLMIFALLAVSRRAIFIPMLLAYFTVVLFDGRWRVKAVVVASLPVLVWVAFGKDVLSAVAFGGSAVEVLGRYQSMSAGILRTASDVGITVVESLGTIKLLHLPPRFGVDHLLAIMHGAPLGWVLHWLGQDRSMPVRIVRLSTRAFATPFDEDIPPGLFGQMWLDFRLAGPIVWALGFAVQLSIMQCIFFLSVRTREAVAVMVLATFVIALPLNTGSFDFSLGVDIFALVLCLLFTFKLSRISLRADPHG